MVPADKDGRDGRDTLPRVVVGKVAQTPVLDRARHDLQVRQVAHGLEVAADDEQVHDVVVLAARLFDRLVDGIERAVALSHSPVLAEGCIYVCASAYARISAGDKRTQPSTAIRRPLLYILSEDVIILAGARLWSATAAAAAAVTEDGRCDVPGSGGANCRRRARMDAEVDVGLWLAEVNKDWRRQAWAVSNRERGMEVEAGGARTAGKDHCLIIGLRVSTCACKCYAGDILNLLLSQSASASGIPALESCRVKSWCPTYLRAYWHVLVCLYMCIINVFPYVDSTRRIAKEKHLPADSSKVSGRRSRHQLQLGPSSRARSRAADLIHSPPDRPHASLTHPPHPPARTTTTAAENGPLQSAVPPLQHTLPQRLHLDQARLHSHHLKLHRRARRPRLPPPHARRDARRVLPAPPGHDRRAIRGL